MTHVAQTYHIYDNMKNLHNNNVKGAKLCHTFFISIKYEEPDSFLHICKSHFNTNFQRHKIEMLELDRVSSNLTLCEIENLNGDDQENRRSCYRIC